MKKPIIKAEKLTKIYIRGTEEVYAVNGVSLEINDGDFIALMGPSGSGKTTFLDLIGCLDADSVVERSALLRIVPIFEDAMIAAGLCSARMGAG